MQLSRLVLLGTLTLSFTAACASDWPAFRGPMGTGLSSDTSAPTHWGPDDHIAWRAPLPRPANGSPIVAAGRVFVTSAEDRDGLQRSLYCFDGESGKRLWVKTVRLRKKMPTHKTNPYAGTTPVSDGQRVVVWHGSAGLYCYDMRGHQLWSTDLGEFKHIWGYGTSPIIYGDKVILNSGPGQRQFIAAYMLESGKPLWETQEPSFGGSGEKRADGKYMGSWSTPLVSSIDGRDQLIVTMPSRVNGYDAESGLLIWTVADLGHDRGDLAYSSPVIAGDLCFVTGGFKGPAMAFRLAGRGDITESNRLWRSEENPQSIGSGVSVDGFVYRPNAGPSTIECIDPETGKTLWTAQPTGSGYWGSIVGAGGLLYVTDQEGATVVFRPNPERFEQVAINHLNEACNATPAISDGQIFIRTAKHLVCIQAKG